MIPLQRCGREKHDELVEWTDSSTGVKKMSKKQIKQVFHSSKHGVCTSFGKRRAVETLNGLDDENAEICIEDSPPPAIKVDFSKSVGSIRPLHGINNSPITYGEPLPELKEAGIPYVRLHDAVGLFGGSHFVDVPNIFPDFHADPEDPSAYDFAFTDAYFKGLIASGVKLMYRLGVTIENQYRIKAYQIHPPKDFRKWAEICAGIIRHYNEGWSHGFEYNIEYWEIWGEPENPPLWQGSKEQYFELYRITANYLKQKFPHLKIGGYGSCGFYTLTRSEPVFHGKFYQSFITFFDDFLKYMTASETYAPIDFFSWHLYATDPHEIIVHAAYVKQRLKQYGLFHTESIFDEWNFIDWHDPDHWDTMKEMPGAVFTAAALCLMQNSSIDKAMYYDALPQRHYCGLYYFPSQKVTKTYYSFKAFNELFKLGIGVQSFCEGIDEVYVCAAKNRSGCGAILIVNRKNQWQEIQLEISGTSGTRLYQLLDSSHLLTETNHLATGEKLKLPPLSVLLVRISK